MNHVVLDIESLSRHEDALVTAIAAVVIQDDGEVIAHFYHTIKASKYAEEGIIGVIDADTVLWWMKQEQRAREEIYKATGLVKQTVKSFVDFIKPYVADENVRVWGNGAEFDNKILKSLIRRCNRDVPWTYKQDACYRTLKQLYPSIKVGNEGVKHAAISDALNQAHHLIELLKVAESKSEVAA